MQSDRESTGNLKIKFEWGPCPVEGPGWIRDNRKLWEQRVNVSGSIPG